VDRSWQCYFRTTPLFETAAVELDWLNRVVAGSHAAQMDWSVRRSSAARSAIYPQWLAE